MSKELNSYELSRNWFDFAFENPELISPNHVAIYFFAIEHCNRLGWRSKFGFPTQMAMDAIGIKKHQTYIRYFNDLVEWGFFKLVQKSQNQYSSNIISLVSDLPKNGKALDKAIINHRAKQTETIGQSNSSIDKQVNHITNKPITNKPILLSEIKISDVPIEEIEFYKIALAFNQLFEKNISEAGGTLKHIKSAKYKNWVNPIRLLMVSDGITKEKLTLVFKFLQNDEFWKKNIQSTETLRKQINKLILAANEKPRNNSGKGLSKEYLANLFG